MRDYLVANHQCTSCNTFPPVKEMEADKGKLSYFEVSCCGKSARRYYSLEKREDFQKYTSEQEGVSTDKLIALAKLQADWYACNRERSEDNVNSPAHYTQHPSGVECIQITEHMGFNLGNAVKYIWRADLKHDAIEDLQKARWYIDRELKKRGVVE